MTTLEPIAIFRSPLRTKFGLPRQAGLSPSLKGRVELLPPYNGPDATRGLEGFDRIWLIWGFNSRSDRLTVRPPRLGGNERLGVFATRSPFRPNPLGLSCVRLVKIRDGVLEVLGADLAEGTEIFDIKPYIPYADCHPDAKGGFTDTAAWHGLEVIFNPEVNLTEEEKRVVSELLAQNPRPPYQDDPDRIYGLDYSEKNIRFKVRDGHAIVVSAEKY